MKRSPNITRPDSSHNRRFHIVTWLEGDSFKPKQLAEAASRLNGPGSFATLGTTARLVRDELSHSFSLLINGQTKGSLVELVDR